jgi:hypothetical protein
MRTSSSTLVQSLKNSEPGGAGSNIHQGFGLLGKMLSLFHSSSHPFSFVTQQQPHACGHTNNGHTLVTCE